MIYHREIPLFLPVVAKCNDHKWKVFSSCESPPLIDLLLNHYVVHILWKKNLFPKQDDKYCFGILLIYVVTYNACKLKVTPHTNVYKSPQKHAVKSVMFHMMQAVIVPKTQAHLNCTRPRWPRPTSSRSVYSCTQTDYYSSLSKILDLGWYYTILVQRNTLMIKAYMNQLITFQNTLDHNTILCNNAVSSKAPPQSCHKLEAGGNLIQCDGQGCCGMWPSLGLSWWSRSYSMTEIVTSPINPLIIIHYQSPSLFSSPDLYVIVDS